MSIPRLVVVQTGTAAPEIVRPFEKSPETDAVDCSLNVVQLIQYVEAERAASRSMSFVHAVRLHSVSFHGVPSNLSGTKGSEGCRRA